MKSKNKISENSILGAVRSIVIGSVVGAALCAILLGVCALAFVSSGFIPQGVISPMMIALSVISSFIAGFVTAKISRKRGLAYGALSGLLLFILFLVSGLIAYKDAIPFSAWIRMLVMVLSGAIGGLLSINKKSKIK
jgi:putative membrane protein (TIGR04086 family)